MKYLKFVTLAISIFMLIGVIEVSTRYIIQGIPYANRDIYFAAAFASFTVITIFLFKQKENV